MLRFVPLLLVFTLLACASTPTAPPYPEAQAVVDAVAERHPDLARLTVHATPAGSSTLTQVASTMPERRGTPSDPEDLTALRTGEVVVLDEYGSLDVTVPILVQGGSATAVAGVTLAPAPDAERRDLLDRARSIARELESELRAADAPLW